MINWISPFNYDFAIATIPIQFILIVFYGIRRNLPTRQSSYFWFIMLSNLIMTSADIISCEMNEIWMKFPLWVMYAINHAYFLAFLIRGWALFAYTAESTSNYSSKYKIFKIITAIPVCVGCILVVSTPWTSAIYTIAEDGYHNCSLYKSIYFSTYFYIIVSILIILKSWNRLSRRMKAGLLSFNLLLLFGILIRKQFYHMLVTSYFSLLSILIIFLTSENPDLYRDNRTRLLNKIALNRIGKELWERNISFSLLTISINNYEASKMVYGVNKINETIKIVANWLMKCYPDELAFYTRNGHYIVLFKKDLQGNDESVINYWKEKYDEFQNSGKLIVPTQISMILLSDNILKNNTYLASDLARYALSTAYAENRKNNFFFSDGMLDGLKNQKMIEKAIKHGITNHRFEVYYQPIYSAKNNKIMGAEALARLNDDEQGIIMPTDFIGIAEKNGDIIEIGKQVFDQVCTFLEGVDTKELGIDFINVNLSPIQCITPNLVQDLSKIAERHNVSMEIFDFEITESVIEDYNAIQTTIAGLRAMGAELSLDDFGTGAANLASLINLPIHVVKIDMSFVRSYFEGKADFLPDLIKLFVHSKMEIVVEGIETKEMMEKMFELGCDYEQGYFFSKPLPERDFVKYMENLRNL